MSHLKTRLFVGAVLGALGLTAAAAEPARDSWLVFRGNPLETGVLPAGALPDKLDELWKFSAKDAIDGAPAVADGVVYVGSEDEHLYAVNLADGSKKWEYKAGPIKASPAYRAGSVYVGDSNGLFHCVDAANGRKRWTFPTGAEITSGANFSDENILFGSYDETLYCLNPDGKQVWMFKTSGPVNGSPAVAGDRTFVAGCDSVLHIIDRNKGTELNSVDLGGQAAATAAVFGDKLYVGTMADDVHEVDWKNAALGWTFQPQEAGRAVFRIGRGDGFDRGGRQPRQARPWSGPEDGRRGLDVPDGSRRRCVAGGGRRPRLRRLAGRQAVRAGPGQGDGGDALRAGQRGVRFAGCGGGAAARGHGEGNALLLRGEEMNRATPSGKSA